MSTNRSTSAFSEFFEKRDVIPLLLEPDKRRMSSRAVQQRLRAKDNADLLELEESLKKITGSDDEEDEDETEEGEESNEHVDSAPSAEGSQDSLNAFSLVPSSPSPQKPTVSAY